MTLDPAKILEGALAIRDLFKRDDPFLVGRNGTVEIQAVAYWFFKRRGKDDAPPYPEHIKDTLERNAGVFPSTDASIDRWAAEYAEALDELDVSAAGWYKPLAAVEDTLLKAFAPQNLKRTPLRSLEPYYVEKDAQWTQELAGKHVCVVTSFATTAAKQAERLDAVWPLGLFPTDVKWSFVRTGYSPRLAAGSAEWPEAVKCWDHAIEYMVAEVLDKNPDIVLIGCGGLGLILGAQLKSLGVSAIVLGGATQVLFGIKGQRWSHHDVISGFWNDAWIFPSATETPKGAWRVEGACYWAPTMS
jgi:hypothetical protein